MILGLGLGTSLSEDVLRVEIAGPDLPHLTLIDLPGLLHSSTKQEDCARGDIAKSLVERYMRRERSIILAIISAEDDSVDQLIIDLVRENNCSKRTLGIITQPDNIASGSPGEKEYHSLVKNQEHYFALGWHILRNGGFTERIGPNFNRDEEEAKFFRETAPWNELREDEVGAKSLRLRLSEKLYEQIQSEFSQLSNQLSNMLHDCRSSLETIGPRRESPGEQRAYLVNLSKRFQTLTRGAIIGDYSGDNFKYKFFELDHDAKKNRGELGNRLRARIRSLSEMFSTDMHERGHRIEIIEDHLKIWGNPADEEPLQKYRSHFIEETRMLLEQNKGLELPGLFPPHLVGDLFRMQSFKWKEVSESFICDAFWAVQEYFDELFSYIAEPSSCNAILDEVIGPALNEMRRMLDEKLKELLSPYTEGFAMTQSPQFIKNVKNLRKLRSDKEDPSMTKAAGEHKDLLVCSELVDCMQAYYKTVIEIFIENVITLGVENCLMKNLDLIFDAEMIVKMDDETLARLASEPLDVQVKRDQLVEQKEILERGLDMLRKQRRRNAAERPSSRKLRKTDSPVIFTFRASRPGIKFGGVGGGSGSAFTNGSEGPLLNGES